MQIEMARCPECFTPALLDEQGNVQQHTAVSGMPSCDGVGKPPLWSPVELAGAVRVTEEATA